MTSRRRRVELSLPGLKQRGFARTALSGGSLLVWLRNVTRIPTTQGMASTTVSFRPRSDTFGHPRFSYLGGAVPTHPPSRGCAREHLQLRGRRLGMPTLGVPRLVLLGACVRANHAVISFRARTVSSCDRLGPTSLTGSFLSPARPQVESISSRGDVFFFFRQASREEAFRP